jgi:RNA polymerase sigma-70 factor, ECF subfamily
VSFPGKTGQNFSFFSGYRDRDRINLMIHRDLNPFFFLSSRMRPIPLAAAPQASTSFTERFELFRPYLLALARQEMPPFLLLGSSGSDLVQETYLAAQMQWNQFRGSSADQILRWLRAILRFQIFHLRQAAREFPAGDLIGTELEPYVEVLTNACDLEDDYLRILRLVKDMPGLQREIVEGRIERDETFKEIGLRLLMSEEATRKAFHRAIEQLRALCWAAVRLSQGKSTT